MLKTFNAMFPDIAKSPIELQGFAKAFVRRAPARLPDYELTSTLPSVAQGAR
jgi:hypothetical protein